MKLLCMKSSLLIVACVTACSAFAQPASAPRSVWTESKVTGSPLPPPPLKTVNRFPNLTFNQPLYIELDSASERLWVGERNGRVYSFPDNPECDASDLFVDLRESFSELTPHATAVGVGSFYGLAFHPDFPATPYCWMTYTLLNKQRRDHLEDGTRLSRFRVLFEDGIPRCDVSSEQILMTWLEGGHNGACLKFGPDGCLYISAGDGEVPNPPDPRRSGQDVTNALATVMRINVNPTDDGPLYSIPADNPFANPAAMNEFADQPVPVGTLPEIWAYGFRNPWKMTFGPDGQLWVGDVGWEMYEMVYNVRKGGNYGWSIMEGLQPVLPNQRRGPGPIRPAAVAYTHAEGASVTGGYVYRGSRFPELVGKYIFGDYETRRIWSAMITPTDNESDALTELTDLIDPSVRIVAFGEDSQNEILMLDFDRGQILGFERNELAGQPSQFPTLLSQTGLFADTANQVAAKGVVPFAINAEMWNDGATSHRWLGVPASESIEVFPKPRRMQQSSLREKMHFPTDSVLAKTIHLTDDDGKRVRLETQLLHFNGKAWSGYSYLWNPAQTDAQLAPAEGTRVQLSEYGNFADRIDWRIHSRSECIRCHNLWVGGPLAFTTPQLNRPTRVGDDQNQLDAMQDSGLLSGKVPEAATERELSEGAVFVDPYSHDADLNARARSYLAINCSHCHQNGAGGTSTIDLRSEIVLEDTKTLNATPTQGLFQLQNAAVITPGSPFQSVLYYRTACSGRGRMPHIGSERVDVSGISMLREWIQTLGSQPANLADPSVAPPSSTYDALRLVEMFDQGKISEDDRAAVLVSVRDAIPEIRNLFTRFQPTEYQRVLSKEIDPDAVLNLVGRPSSGAELFFAKRTQCVNCHKIGEKGNQVGPKLDDVGKRLKSSEILESILKPSQKIDPKFATWTIVTVEGKVHSGLLVDRNESEFVLRSADNKEVRVARELIDEQFQQVTSLMPERLLNGLSDQQVADILAFLAEQKGR